MAAPGEPPDRPDERGVAGPDVAHLELGLGQVDERVPPRLSQDDACDDERDGQHHEHPDHEHRGATAPPPGAGLHGAQYGI